MDVEVGGSTTQGGHALQEGDISALARGPPDAPQLS
jgi:hypothetical protein